MSGDIERVAGPEPASATSPDALHLELDDLLAALVLAVVREGGPHGFTHK